MQFTFSLIKTVSTSFRCSFNKNKTIWIYFHKAFSTETSLAPSLFYISLLISGFPVEKDKTFQDTTGRPPRDACGRRYFIYYFWKCWIEVETIPASFNKCWTMLNRCWSHLKTKTRTLLIRKYRIQAYLFVLSKTVESRPTRSYCQRR
jgi:hypothetical protein